MKWAAFLLAGFLVGCMVSRPSHYVPLPPLPGPVSSYELVTTTDLTIVTQSITLCWQYPVTSIKSGMAFVIEQSTNMLAWIPVYTNRLTASGSPPWKPMNDFCVTLQTTNSRAFFKVGAHW